MKRTSQKGSAVVELAIVAVVMAVLIQGSVTLFRIIIPQNENAVAMRTEAFRVLETTCGAGAAANGDLVVPSVSPSDVGRQAVVWIDHKKAWSECQ